MKYLFKRILYLCLVLVPVVSCDTDPTIADADELNIENPLDARNMINGAYYDMASSNFMGAKSILTAVVRSDNAYSNGLSFRFIELGKFTPKADPANNDRSVRTIWQYGYSAIGKANVVLNSDIEDLFETNEVNQDEIYHTFGEAYAIRAFVHFTLLQLYGQQYITSGDLGIPYIKEYQPEEDKVKRASVESNKQDIYNDINEAIKNMEKGINADSESSKIHFNLDAVYAMISRVATYFGDYDIVRDISPNIYGKYPITLAEDYIKYWSDSSPGAESIFELNLDDQYVDDGTDPISLQFMFRFISSTGGDIQGFDNLLEDADFDNGDIRASEGMIKRIDGRLRNVGKYPAPAGKQHTDNIKVFRYSEVVLNYAEALYNEDPNSTEALDLLNEVAIARNANPYIELNLENILKERRKEFLFEGMRTFDLQRTGTDLRDIDPTSPNNHGFVPAGDDRWALPLPQHEIDANENLIQNPGY